MKKSLFEYVRVGDLIGIDLHSKGRDCLKIRTGTVIEKREESVLAVVEYGVAMVEEEISYKDIKWNFH